LGNRRTDCFYCVFWLKIAVVNSKHILATIQCLATGVEYRLKHGLRSYPKTSAFVKQRRSLKDKSFDFVSFRAMN
jgi:hypothetical protein